MDMKKIFYSMMIVAASMMLSSCIGDLDTLPLNETDSTSETAYADAESYLKGLAYINAYWAFVSQNDPGSSDLKFDDAGKSELTRMYMLLNELSTDSFKCIWGDDFVAAIQYHSWTDADNSALIAAYSRCMKGITMANEYLLQTTDDKLALRGHEAFASQVAGYRAEARFHRALYYWVLMDLFGNPPFALEENIGGALPEQIGRTALFEWIEAECLDLLNGSDMPAKGAVPYPRPTKGSVAALLARMYLNAGVYTGVARWQDAKDMAKKVIDMGYVLHSNYADLFAQDNTTNGAAADEFIFAIDYDKDHAQSWGGTTTLVSGTLSEEANSRIANLLGIAATTINPENWNGYHVADDYVARFHLNGVTWGGDGFGYDRATSDKRAFFFNGGATKDFGDNTSTATGWLCWKFNGLYSDGHVNSSSVDNYKFASSDYPIFRLAEMYLIYAEADARINGGIVSDGTAKGYIKALRDRAGVDMPADDELTLDWLLDERARELMWEGHRRTDLIRYDYFCSMQFPWTFKGNVPNGKIALPSFRTIYPIIKDDLNANPKLVQNPGY
jgi:SusD family.